MSEQPEKLIRLGVKRPSPPSFEEAKNRRQKVRAAGLHPDYWYPVEWDKNIARGQVVEVKFWGRSFALFRGQDGQLRALENRCAHRQLKLSCGAVTGNNVTCEYHGWQYDGSGRCVVIPHDLFGNKRPDVRVNSYPVKVRYGLIWIFPGDKALAESRKLPEIPEIEGDDPWGTMGLDFTWDAHHSMIIDNVSDFSHAYLHRRSQPFVGSKLTKLEAQEDRVLLAYDTQVGRGKISGLFVDRGKTNTESMTLAYEYPYQWSNTDDKIKHWCFVLPIEEQKTRVFFIFYFSPNSLKIPFTSINFPGELLRKVVMPIAQRVLVRPLLSEDGVAVQAEQAGYNSYYDQPIVELNPAVNEFQKLTIRKWEEHLAKSRGNKAAPKAEAQEAAEPAAT